MHTYRPRPSGGPVRLQVGVQFKRMEPVKLSSGSRISPDCWIMCATLDRLRAHTSDGSIPCMPAPTTEDL